MARSVVKLFRGLFMPSNRILSTDGSTISVMIISNHYAVVHFLQKLQGSPRSNLLTYGSKQPWISNRRAMPPSHVRGLISTYRALIGCMKMCVTGVKLSEFAANTWRSRSSRLWIRTRINRSTLPTYPKVLYFYCITLERPHFYLHWTLSHK